MKKLKSLPLPLLIGGIVLLVVLIGGAVLIFGGDGDGGGGSPSAGIQSGDKGSTPARPRVNPKGPPIVTTGSVTARKVGPFAVAQARVTVRNPSRIRIRVSAAPKQYVTVNWQLGCFVNRRTASNRGHYFTRTPNTRELPLPAQNAISCIVTATAQLTRRGTGRIKVSAIAG